MTILPDGSAVGIWRKCENTPGTACESECCTFPHLLTATDWKDPGTYNPHSEHQMFRGIKPYGAEDPMLWVQDYKNKTIVRAILHDEQGPHRSTAIGRYAYSDDGGTSWTYAGEDAYNGTVVWTDGTTSNLYRRERPVRLKAGHLFCLSYREPASRGY